MATAIVPSSARAPRVRTWVRRATCAWALLASGVLAASPLAAQAPESDTAPLPGQFEPAPLPAPATPFVVPDAPHADAAKAEPTRKWFTLKVGLVLIADYTAFGQDDTSEAQVGRQDDQWDDRAARLMFRGTAGRLSYIVAGEYKGFDSDPDETWQLTDASITIPVGGPATRLTIGKTKETFAYEMVGDAANLPHQERILSPFFVSRNVGVRLSSVFGTAHRITASAGVFNDWWVDGETFSESGTDVSARVTGLAIDEDEGRRFLHLGVAGRYATAERDAMRFRGRPESNVADYFLDTGTLTGDGARHLGLETLYNDGPFSVLAEYNRAWVAAPSSGDPTFWGWYVTASYVLTGETRPYDRTVGYARRVMPRGRWGAPEIVVRFSHVDLDDGAVQGGAFDKTYLGLNWWATRRWKFGAGWGHTWLDRFATTGGTHALHTRMQWVY